MAKQNIEKILEGVRAVEAHDSEAGIAVRRVVEQAENTWNEHPHNLDLNKENVVVKRFSAEDLRAAADRSGLAANANVQAFIAVVEGWPEPPAPTDTELAEAAAAVEESETAKAVAAQTAESLMKRAFGSAAPSE